MSKMKKDLMTIYVRSRYPSACLYVSICVCVYACVCQCACVSVCVACMCMYILRVCVCTHQYGFIFYKFDAFHLILFYIIRSIDFAKANSNIALVPRLETVCIPEALAVAVTVIRFVVTIQYLFFLDYSIPFYLILFYSILL